MTLHAQLKPTILEPWLSMEPVRVGSVPRSLCTPDTYVTVLDGDKPVLRVDVYGDHGREAFVSSTAITWQKWLVIGFGDHTYLVGLHDRTTVTMHLGNYFAGLYAGSGCLLVASASHIFRFDPDGALLWQSDELGIDGVEILNMSDGIVRGRGEWDPPGGWRLFAVDVANGRLIAGTQEIRPCQSAEK